MKISVKFELAAIRPWIEEWESHWDTRMVWISNKIYTFLMTSKRNELSSLKKYSKIYDLRLLIIITIIEKIYYKPHKNKRNLHLNEKQFFSASVFLCVVWCFLVIFSLLSSFKGWSCWQKLVFHFPFVA